MNLTANKFNKARFGKLEGGSEEINQIHHRNKNKEY
jgi:hypothetical protein